MCDGVAQTHAMRTWVQEQHRTVPALCCEPNLFSTKRLPTDGVDCKCGTCICSYRSTSTRRGQTQRHGHMLRMYDAHPSGMEYDVTQGREAYVWIDSEHEQEGDEHRFCGKHSNMSGLSTLCNVVIMSVCQMDEEDKPQVQGTCQAHGTAREVRH